MKSLVAGTFVLLAASPSVAAPMETVIYSLDGGKKSSAFPEGGLTANSSGQLFGTGSVGGLHDAGAIFRLTPPPKGKTAWKAENIFNFGGRTGGGPATTLAIDSAGNFYGALNDGGANGQGEIFELSPPADGGADWSEQILHSFGGQGDGEHLNDAMILDKAGNVYGTTFDGGAYNFGIAYELSPPAAGKKIWSETILHNFGNPAGDSDEPLAGLVADSQFNLFGAASHGGSHFEGSVFEVTP